MPMIDSQVAAFTVVAFILTLTPGADTLLVIRNAMLGGRWKGMATTAGICFGLFFHAALSAIGVSMILLHSATLFNTVKMAGAFYLSWLGIKSIHRALKSNIDVSRQTLNQSENAMLSPERCFFEGFFCNVLNPKVALFYLAFLPQFLGPHDPVIAKSLLLALIHFIEAFVWLVLVSLMVERIRRLLKKPVVLAWVEGVCGAVLMALGIRLACDNL